MLQLLKQEETPAGVEDEIVLAVEGGSEVVLRIEADRVSTMRKAARISGRPLSEYARIQALRMIRNG